MMDQRLYAPPVQMNLKARKPETNQEKRKAGSPVRRVLLPGFLV
jgi:hypothetical protein